MSLYGQYLNNKGPSVYKWHHYFPVYERHFSHWKNRALTFWEIGVLSGGSLAMWQQYFGPYARIIGIDIDPACKSHEKQGISVRIGNQSDPVFLDAVVREFGVPDIVLDDGSHRMSDLWATFQHLYPLMGKNGIYAIEDLHTCYWPEYGGGLHHPDSMIEKAKSLIDELNADHARGAVKPDQFTKSTYSLCFYDSLLMIEKGDVWRKEADAIGSWDREFPRPEMRVGS
jgi:hypothetical protein